MPSLSETVSFIFRALQFELFSVKQTKVTIASLLLLLVIMIGFAIFSRIAVRTILARVLNRTRLDEGVRYTLSRITHYIIVVVGAIVAFQFIGVDLSGIVVIFGFLSVGIGFGLQNLTSNFISGLILLFERPIKVGDRVTVSDIEGDVVEINIRSTTVRSLNNIAIIVPNSEFISQRVINWSHGDPKVRIDVEVGVSYNSDLETVLRCLKQVGEENIDVIEKPEPEVLFLNFGDSSWNMRLRAWILDPKRHQQVRSDLNCAIVSKFRENHVEIPFPQRDLHVRSQLPIPNTSGKIT